MDWLILFIYTFGAIANVAIVIMGVITMRSIWLPSNGKIIKANEIKLAGKACGVACMIILFLALLGVVYQKSVFIIALSFIASIGVGFISGFFYAKLIDGLVINYTEAYNRMRSDDLL